MGSNLKDYQYRKRLLRMASGMSSKITAYGREKERKVAAITLPKIPAPKFSQKDEEQHA